VTYTFNGSYEEFIAALNKAIEEPIEISFKELEEARIPTTNYYTRLPNGKIIPLEFKGVSS